MASFPVHLVNLRCDGCGREIRTLEETAAKARDLAAVAGWTSGRKVIGMGRRVFDACRDCDLPEGYI